VLKAESESSDLSQKTFLTKARGITTDTYEVTTTWHHYILHISGQIFWIFHAV